LALWPSAFAAGLIGYTVSAASIATCLRVRPAGSRPGLNAKGTVWFALVGLCNGIAVFSMYAAFNIGAVTVVAPVVATYPLFSYLFSLLLLPQERIRPNTLVGVALTGAGVAALLLA
jgi:uncharacterized membrane protein